MPLKSIFNRVINLAKSSIATDSKQQPFEISNTGISNNDISSYENSSELAEILKSIIEEARGKSDNQHILAKLSTLNTYREVKALEKSSRRRASSQPTVAPDESNDESITDGS